MNVSQYNSIKFKWLSLVAIFCVVFGHSFQNQGLFFDVTIPILAQWHVPWFFFLSGILLHYSFSKQASVSVLKKKMKGLVLPYIVWALIAYFISGGFYQIGFNCDKMFGITTAFPVGNPHLWYLHVLISFSLISVLIWMCVGRLTLVKSIVAFSVLYLLIYGLALSMHCSTLYGTPSSPFYFLAGFVLSHQILKQERMPPKKCLCYFLIAASMAIALRFGWFILKWHGMKEVILRMICVVFQIGAVWFGYDVIADRLGKVDFHRYITPIFFVYCFHGLLLPFLKKSWVLCCGNSTIYCNVGVVFVCFFTIIFSFAAANLLRWSLPKVYGILTGGR